LVIPKAANPAAVSKTPSSQKTISSPVDYIPNRIDQDKLPPYDKTPFMSSDDIDKNQETNLYNGIIYQYDETTEQPSISAVCKIGNNSEIVTNKSYDIFNTSKYQYLIIDCHFGPEFIKNLIYFSDILFGLHYSACLFASNETNNYVINVPHATPDKIMEARYVYSYINIKKPNPDNPIDPTNILCNMTGSICFMITKQSKNIFNIARTIHSMISNQTINNSIIPSNIRTLYCINKDGDDNKHPPCLVLTYT